MIELLVVIAIIAILTSLGLVGASRLQQSAQKTASVSNLRQIGVLLGAHASDNGNKLPAPRAEPSNGKGGYDQLHWFEALLKIVYPNLSTADWRGDGSWWNKNKPVVRHPLVGQALAPATPSWWQPGYAMNTAIASNLVKGTSFSSSPSGSGPQTYAIPLGLITEPSRTPIVAPRTSWNYTYNAAQLQEPSLTNFLVAGKLTILFVDGHVESMLPADYTSRELDKMPRR